MTDTIAEDLSVTDKFFALLRHRVIVRYLLSLDGFGNQDMFVRLISAPGVPDQNPEHFIMVAATLTLASRSRSKLDRVISMSGNEAQEQFEALLYDWKDKRWEPWLEPTEFVGMTVLTNDSTDQDPVMRELPASHPLFAFYTGLLVGLLSAAEHDAYTAVDKGIGHRANANALTGLLQRFRAFAEQNQANLVTQMLGTALKSS